MTTAINTVNALSNSLKTESGTALSVTGNGQIISASSGTLDGNGNEVFTVAANAFNNNSGGLTISGTSSQFVVININNGTSNEALNGPISLTGGITADQVLFNFTGTGNLQGGSTNGSIENGIFLAPNMNINLSHTTIDGRLFGGAAGRDFQLVSGFNLNAPPAPPPSPAPAPPSLALVLTAIPVGLVGWLRGRRRTGLVVTWSTRAA